MRVQLGRFYSSAIVLAVSVLVFSSTAFAISATASTGDTEKAKCLAKCAEAAVTCVKDCGNDWICKAGCATTANACRAACDTRSIDDLDAYIESLLL